MGGLAWARVCVCVCVRVTRTGLIAITQNFLVIGGSLTWWEYQTCAVYDIRTIRCEIVHMQLEKIYVRLGGGNEALGFICIIRTSVLH